MTDEKLQKLILAASACAGEDFDYFGRRIDEIGSLSDSELFAFAGALLAYECGSQANVVARYAIVVDYARSTGRDRPLPKAVMDEWEREVDDDDGHISSRNFYF